MTCCHLLLVRQRMIIISIGKHSARTLSQQRPNRSLARSAYTHQHNDHPTASSRSSSTTATMQNLPPEATLIRPETKTRIGDIEDLFPIDCVPTVCKRGRVVLRCHL